MKRAHLTVLAVAALVPVLLAGCGSSSSDAASSSPAAAESSAAPSESAPEEPAESSSAPESSAPAGEALDRDAALVELGRQVTESGFSAEAAGCIVQWGTTLSDADLAVAAAPPGVTPSPEQQAAQADILIECARQEVVDLFIGGFSETELSETAQACLSDYMNNLNDDELRAILASDPTAMQELSDASQACALEG